MCVSAEVTAPEMIRRMVTAISSSASEKPAGEPGVERSAGKGFSIPWDSQS